VETFEFSCPAAGPGEHLRYPDPAHCGRYYVCIAGAAQQHHCPPGLVFHPDSLACTVQADIPSRSPCSQWLNATVAAAARLPDPTPSPTPAPRPDLAPAQILANAQRRPQRPALTSSGAATVAPARTRPAAPARTRVDPRLGARVRTRVRGGAVARVSSTTNRPASPGPDLLAATTERGRVRLSLTRTRTRTRTPAGPREGGVAPARQRSRVRLPAPGPGTAVLRT